jgi:hypothetical protein
MFEHGLLLGLAVMLGPIVLFTALIFNRSRHANRRVDVALEERHTNLHNEIESPSLVPDDVPTDLLLKPTPSASLGFGSALCGETFGTA